MDMKFSEAIESSTEARPQLAEKIAEIEVKLEKLGEEIEEIGYPAAVGLRRRLDTLHIEERALKRNIDESVKRDEPNEMRMAKIETLLRHIEAEEDSIQEDAEFLNRAAPSSMAVIAETGAHVVDLLARAVKRVIGDHHPFGSSVFVNHTHENLVEYHGLHEDPPDEAPSERKPK